MYEGKHNRFGFIAGGIYRPEILRRDIVALGVGAGADLDNDYFGGRAYRCEDRG